MTTPDRLPDTARPPERLTFTRPGVELTALAALLAVRLGRPVVLGGSLPEDDPEGRGVLQVRDGETGEVLDVAQAVLDEALSSYTDPVPSGPAVALAESAAAARTVDELANAVVAYAVALTKGA